MTRTIRESLLLTTEMQNEDRYVRVPFEVALGTPSLEVRIRYDRRVGVIDLGCEGPAGWRGWSGGARTGFVIGADDATPGYCPGPLEPGTWAVVLGLHALPADGAPIEIDILLPAESPIDHGLVAVPVTDVPRGSMRRLPAPRGLHWFAGDFHAHTIHSDGAESISQLAARAARAGLDFLAITEHNTISHHRHLSGEGARHGITLIPGQEMTTHRGHANAFGDIGFIDFRRPGSEWAEEVAHRGGLFSINHPISDDCSWLHPLERVPNAVELWHGTWYKDLSATSVLAWYCAWRHRVALIGGSDFHSCAEPIGPGTPTTWVAAEDSSVEAIMAGVAEGRTAIMGGATLRDGVAVPDIFTAPVLLRVDGEVIAIDADGLVLVDALGRRQTVHGNEVGFVADPAHGPHCLVDANRKMVALCA